MNVNNILHSSSSSWRCLYSKYYQNGLFDINNELQIALHYNR